MMLIISREYTSRVKKKGFIITTLLMPLIFVGLMFLPVLLSEMNDGPKEIVVIDHSEQLTPALVKSGLPLKFTNQTEAEVFADEANSMVLVIGEDAVENPSNIAFYNREATGMELNMMLNEILSTAIEDVRLENLGQPQVRRMLESVKAEVNITTLKVNANGEAENSDATTSFLIGMAMTFVLYMFIMIYGQMVMSGIIEEKNNRVLEILVSSVKPFQLMMGKLIGIGAVAVTQITIWVVIIAFFVSTVLPNIASPELQATLSVVELLGSVFSIFGYLILFLVGGFLLYASIYAAIGASVDNIQDGSQLQTFAIVPVIIALVLAMSIAENPDSSIATIFSIIPFTSPMVMMARIPSGVDTWELLLSVAVLYSTVVFLIWLTAKIYRVGIFMYGKKPNIKELIKWAKYK